MPTVTTTVTSAAASGAVTTQTTTEATPEDHGFTWDGTFHSWSVNLPADKVRPFVQFDAHLTLDQMAAAFANFTVTGNRVGDTRVISLLPEAGGFDIVEQCIATSESGYSYMMKGGSEVFGFQMNSYRGSFSVAAVTDTTSTITWTNTYLSSDPAATLAALLGFVPLIGSAWEGLDAKLNPPIVASQSPYGADIDFEDPASLPFPMPNKLEDITAGWMEALLKHRGMIPASCKVTSINEKGVGMTAGYFSSIKKVECIFSEEVTCPSKYVCKAWPAMEIMPKENIKAMFITDMKGYSDFKSTEFYPRPNVYLATYDADHDQWALVMEDVDSYGEHRITENPLNLEEVMKMIPQLTTIAAAFETNDPAADGKAPHVNAWGGPDNIAAFETAVGMGAVGADKALGCESIGEDWAKQLGPDFCQRYRDKLAKFWSRAAPENAHTCTLAHGDIRGDNLFTVPGGEGWQVIDFQLMFFGPVPSDLAYIMATATCDWDTLVNHEDEILRAFYDQYMAKTKINKDYTFEQMKEEYAMMSLVVFTYYVGFGAAFFLEGEQDRDFLAPELGSGKVKADDLPKDQQRKRFMMKAIFKCLKHLFVKYDMSKKLDSL